jgi:hypothetical protein
MMQRIVLVFVQDEDLLPGHVTADLELTEQGMNRACMLYEELQTHFGDLGEVKLLVGPSDMGYATACYLAELLGADFMGQPVRETWHGMENFLEKLEKLKPWDTLLYCEHPSNGHAKDVILTWNKYATLFGKLRITGPWPPYPHHIALVIEIDKLGGVTIAERDIPAAS